MSRPEDSDEPEHTSSIREEILRYEGSISSGGVPLTSTSSTTCETSDQTSTTEPPLYYSVIDATINHNESMRRVLLKKLYSTYTGAILAATFFILLSIIALSYNLIPVLVGLPLIFGSSLFTFSLILELKEKKYFDRDS